MAIGARVSPEVIVFGTVMNWRSNTWEGEYRGTRVTIDTAGGPLVVSYRAESDGERPPIGADVAVVASAFDGARGSSLSFERELSHGDLDLIASRALSVPAGK